MTELRVKTKGDARPNGKPKVYFTCHPDDVAFWLETVIEDLHAANDCAVYYAAEMALAFEDADWGLDLSRMQLFVVPVTFRLLTEPNRAMDVDIAFARSRNIPILPIMVESGIDGFYSARFGELQYLSPHGDGHGGGVGYREKLKLYLETVLIGEKEASRIRSAFDAYVFLSYRKVDRRLADNFIRTVHSDPRCRDIALWYDEFLTPGESFRDNIDRALANSQLFALLVTPNILERINDEPNFVMGVEYPAACDADIEIVAVEAQETNRDNLLTEFSGLPEPISLQNQSEKALLLDSISCCAVAPSESDPLHNYLVGLAYLKGIDVEIDAKRGVELIVSAAEMDLPEAMEQLIYLYRNGDGVSLDYAEAVRWSEHLYAHRSNNLGESHPDTLRSLSNLASYYDDLGDYPKAAELGEKAWLTLRDSLGEKHPNTLGSLSNLASYYDDLGDYPKAAELGEKAWLLRRESLGESHPDTLMSLSNLANDYCGLGNFKKAAELGEEAWRLRREVLGATDVNTLTSLSNLAVFFAFMGDCQKAINIGEEAWQLRYEALGKIHPHTLASLSNLASYYDDSGDYSKAAHLGKEAWLLQCDVLGEAHPDTVRSLSHLAVYSSNLGDYQKAVQFGENALRLQQNTLGRNHPDTRVTLSNLANDYDRIGNPQKAAELRKNTP